MAAAAGLGAASQSVIFKIYHLVARQFSVCAVQWLRCDINAADNVRVTGFMLAAHRIILWIWSRYPDRLGTQQLLQWRFLQSPLCNMLKLQCSCFRVLQAPKKTAAVVAPWKEHSGGLKGTLINFLPLWDSSPSCSSISLNLSLAGLWV